MNKYGENPDEFLNFRGIFIVFLIPANPCPYGIGKYLLLSKIPKLSSEISDYWDTHVFLADSRDPESDSTAPGCIGIDLRRENSLRRYSYLDE